MKQIPADKVRESVSRHMHVTDFGLVADLARSSGRRLVDAATGRSYLDFFTFYASNPIGMNHPKMKEPAFSEKLLRSAMVKPSNPDVYTVELAEFVETFYGVAVPEGFPHLFLIDGGALAVENALKVAFDWKVRKNLARGQGERGQQVIHFREAFHGRSGYTLSMTNTADPRKTMYFPRFEWPRILNPKARFPLEGDHLEATVQAEKEAEMQILEALRANPDDIAAILIETIQGEGGDNHFRPEFLRTLRRIADAHELMLIFDEVQTGIGLTGKMWAFQHFGVTPDIIVFGKKAQICGLLAGPRVDEVERNVFVEESRINSTWGGNLADMVRATRYFEIIDGERLVENAAATGAHLLSRLQALQQEFPAVVSNVRGRGLMCAFDLGSDDVRDAVRKRLFQDGLLILKAGLRSLRFRPPLDVTRDEIDEGIGMIRKALRASAGAAASAS